MSKEDLLKKAYQLGFQGEHDVHGCAQCVIAAVQDALGIRNDIVYKSASGLAGGVGECTDGNCGAVSGGTVAMSMFFGRTREEAATQKGRQEKYVSSRMAAALHDKFMEKYGTVICREIHVKIYGRSFLLRDEGDKQDFRAAGAHEREDGCCAVVGDGARWATELILDEIEANGLALDDFQYLIDTQN